MNIRKTLSGYVWTFLACAFFGFILCSIAAGAVVPAVDKFAAGWIVCSKGTFEIHQDTYSYRPGESDTMTTDYCVDKTTGAKTDISLVTMIVAGLVYSVVLFVIVLAFTLVNKRSRLLTVEADHPSNAPSSAPAAHRPSGSSGSSHEKRLQELKHMYDSKLIDAQEYEQKKKQILDEM